MVWLQIVKVWIAQITDDGYSHLEPMSIVYIAPVLV
jgi:hypothetical protein